MALVKCSECGEQISDNSTACVHCGHKTAIRYSREPEGGCFAGCFVVIFLIYFLFGGCFRATDKPVDSQTQEVVFNSAWDGSVWQADKYLKKIAKDPDSIEYIGWAPVKKTPEGFQVGVSLRAKNSFGAKVIENYLVKFDRSGGVVSCE